MSTVLVVWWCGEFRVKLTLSPLSAASGRGGACDCRSAEARVRNGRPVAAPGPSQPFQGFTADYVAAPKYGHCHVVVLSVHVGLLDLDSWQRPSCSSTIVAWNERFCFSLTQLPGELLV